MSSDAIRPAIPQGFADMIAGYRTPLTDGLVEALASTAPSVAVRYNRAKGGLPDGAPGSPVPWLPGLGRYLDERPSFTLDPALHQGRYYVQDASSMFIARVIGQLAAGFGRPLRYLDACAAPGGKTTAAIDALPAGSVVIANEIVPARAAVLRENVVKWGYPHAIVTRADTRALARALKGSVDIVAADVPCSGEGMMRKDADAVAQWSTALIAECADRQREIVDNLWRAVAPGGYLIYSTCTFNRDENELMLRYLVDNYGAIPVAVNIDGIDGIAPGIDTPHPCYRFMPHRVDGEGLFMAVVRKPGEPKKQKMKEGKRKGHPQPPPCAKWIDLPDVQWDVTAERINAMSPGVADAMAALRDAVDVLHHGVPVATVKGRDIIPTHALAMSTSLRADAFHRVATNRTDALEYLRRNAIPIPADTPRGIVLLTYEDHPLGWLKNLGNRANNLYPAPWRIHL